MSIPIETIKDIQRLRSIGATYDEIAKQCDVSHATVVKYCKNLKSQQTPQLQLDSQDQLSLPSDLPSDLPPEYHGVKNLQVDQTLRENAQWAIEAAGEKHRTGKEPTECPNDTAFFLYLQAVDNPKDFFAKFSQIESKANEVNTFKRACQLSIQEIDEMIDEIRYLDSLPTFLRS